MGIHLNACVFLLYTNTCIEVFSVFLLSENTAITLLFPFMFNYRECCKGKSKDKVLNVHHIESRKTYGDTPDNLITLCETCNTGYHNGTVKLPKTIQRGMSFRDATFMGIIRWAFYNKLRELYPNVSITYGYITKNTRMENGFPKDHYIDARCISGNGSHQIVSTIQRTLLH